MNITKLAVTLPLALLLTAGCSDSDDTQTAQIEFAAKVNGVTYTEDTTYNDVGIADTAYKPEDLRFFISSVSLKTDGGAVIPVMLTEDGVWQYKNTRDQ